MAAFAILAGCSGPLDRGRTVGLIPGGDFVGRIQSFDEQRYASVVRQRYDFSCGSAALATLLRYHYGDRVWEADVFQGMWKAGDKPKIRRLGFSLLDMKRYLGARGVSATGFAVELDDIAKGGTPGIALVNLNGYKHFVVVKGVREDEVLVGDPSRGLQVLSAAEFKKSWNGVYFVLDPDAFKGRFNAAQHWAGYARAPVWGGFIQPLSQQALALTAPFYRDF
jgi:uncharacterized protein